jgi:hypothetical protein
MGFKLLTTKEQIRKTIADKISSMDAAIISRFKFVGEQFIIDARNSGGYKDQTGNLRNSICYLILRNGVVVSVSSFTSSGGRSAGKGATKGKEFILLVAKDYPKGYVLICAAGMEYAAAVESRGKDVITGSSQLAESKIRLALTSVTEFK